MLLVLDVGNTTTVLGIYDGETLVKHWRLRSDRRTSDELGVYLLNLLDISGIPRGRIRGAIYSSVAPALDVPLSEGLKNYLSVDPLKVTSSLDLGMEIAYYPRHEVGADRLVNSVAGKAAYGAPLIVADFGTAITLDIINSDGAYLGGTISPGLVTGMEALFGRTANLLPLEEGPFYAVYTIPYVLMTSGGPRINGQGQLVRADDSVVKGAYLAGEIIGSANVGGNTTIGGIGHGLCVTWGIIAAENAVENAGK